MAYQVYEVCSNSILIGIVVVVHWVGCVSTSLDIFVHVLATHDTSCKWLRLINWVYQVAEVTRAFMSQRFLRCVKVPNNAFASSFVLKSDKPQRKHIHYCSKHTVKMQLVVHRFLTGSVDLKRVEPPLKATPLGTTVNIEK